MRSLGKPLISGALSPYVSQSAEDAAMGIKRGGSQPSTKGPADWFTGTVRIDPLFAAPDPGRGAAPW